MKNPDLGRYLILMASCVTDDELLFAPDFNLAYTLPGGSEERSTCDAIAVASFTKAGHPDIEDFVSGECPRIPLRNTGRVTLALAFYLEGGVTDVCLRRPGTDEQVSYHLGSERPYTVFATTNRSHGEEVLRKAQMAVGRAGCVAHISQGLNPDHRGVTVSYAPTAKRVATEVASQVRRTLGVQPELVELGPNYVYHYDVLLWIGR